MPDLDDIERCLDVGRPAVLSVAVRRGNERAARAIIRGWQRGSYVLLDVPDATGLGVGPRVGDHCKLRFLADGDACGLDATLIDLGSGSHFSYVKIAWPHGLTLSRVRRHQRVQVRIPCTVQVETGNPAQGEIHDISAGGCRIALDRPLPQRTQIVVAFELPGNAAPFSVAAETCAAGAFPGGAWLGCKFVDADDALRYAVDFFVATTAANLRATPRRTNSVLIVNADAQQTAALKQALVSKDLDVTTAPNLVDAFFWLRAAPPSLLVLHAEPKPFRGVDAVAALRAVPAFASLPILLYGGAPGDRDAALKAGATQFFAAPAQVQELVTAVMACLAPAS